MDEKKPLVSVAMSVYNGGQWLQAAIESIIHQTYSNWEFIIIDDGSNDATPEILNQYNIDSRFRIIRNPERKGLTKNLNKAIGASNGELIARMDADDISQPARFEKQVDYLLMHPEISVIGSFIDIIDENGTSQGSWPDDRKTISWEKIRSLLPWRNCIAHPTVMIRKKVLENYSYDELQVSTEDWDLWLRLAADGFRIEKINEPLLLYRVHGQSITSTTLKRSSFLMMHKAYKRYLQNVFRNRKFNVFNLRIMIAFLFNRVKLFLSSIKRAITS